MMKTTLKALFLILFLSAMFRCAQPSEYEAAIAESHRIIDSLRQAQKIPGIDIAVWIDGKVVWSEGFGNADLEQQQPVRPGETRFRIGSVSKSLTAAALAKLHDAGKLDLAAPVQQYVSYFPEKKYPITVKQVAGHIAGIRHYRGNEFLINSYYPTVQESLSIFKDDSLMFEPGSRFGYSSYGFNLLSAVVEGASGDSFLSYMQREVFNPLGMNATTADRTDSILVNRTSFYQLDSLSIIRNAPYVDNSYKWAGGGFLSTTTDLIKFGEAHLKPGYLSEGTLTEWLTPQVLTTGDTTHYGVGWFIYRNEKRNGFGHGGGSVGGITLFQVYPSDKLILVILSNSSDTSYGNTATRIIDLFLEAKNN